MLFRSVQVDFNPTVTPPPGVDLSVDPTNLIRVTITRTLQNGLIRFLGPLAPSISTIRAAGTAAIIDHVSPIPIIVMHRLSFAGM